MLTYKFGSVLFDYALFVPMIFLNINAAKCLFSSENDQIIDSISEFTCKESRQVALSVISIFSIVFLISLRAINALYDFDSSIFSGKFEFCNRMSPFNIMIYQAVGIIFCSCDSIFRWRINGHFLFLIFTMASFFSLVTSPIFYSQTLTKIICFFWGSFLIAQIFIVFGLFNYSSNSIYSFILLCAMLILYLCFFTLKSFKSTGKLIKHESDSATILFNLKRLLFAYKKSERLQNFDCVINIVYNHQRHCKKPDCQLTSIIDDLSDKQKDNQIFGERLKTQIYDYFESVCVRLITDNFADENIVLSYCSFLSEATEKKGRAFAIINRFSKKYSVSLVGQYRLHCLKKIILQSDSGDRQIGFSKIESQLIQRKNLHEAVISLYRRLTLNSIEFWEAASQDEVNYQKMTQMAYKIFDDDKLLEKKILELCYKNNDDLRLILVYSFFLKVLFCRDDASREVMKSVKRNMKSIDSLQDKEVDEFLKRDLSEFLVATIIADITDERKMLIINANALAIKMFGQEDASFKDQEISFIIPEWMDKVHNTLINDFKKNIEAKPKILKKTVLAKNASNEIFPLIINMKYLYDSNHARQFMILFMQKDKSFDDSYFIVLDSSYAIVDCTNNCQDLFGMNQRMLNMNPDINFWIKDFALLFNKIKDAPVQQFTKLRVKGPDQLETADDYLERKFLVELITWDFTRVSAKKFYILNMHLIDFEINRESRQEIISFKKTFPIKIKEKRFADLIQWQDDLYEQDDLLSVDSSDNDSAQMGSTEQSIERAKRIEEKYTYMNIQLLILKNNKIYLASQTEQANEDFKEGIKDEMRAYSINYSDSESQIMSKSEKNLDKFVVNKLDLPTFRHRFQNYFSIFSSRNLFALSLVVLLMLTSVMVTSFLIFSFYQHKQMVNVNLNHIFNNKMNRFLHIAIDIESHILAHHYKISHEGWDVIGTAIPKIINHLRYIKSCNQYIQENNYLYLYYDRSTDIFFQDEDPKHYDMYVLEQLIVSRILKQVDKIKGLYSEEVFSAVNEGNFFIITNLLNGYYLQNEKIIAENLDEFNRFAEQGKFALQMIKAFLGLICIIVIVIYYTILYIVHGKNVNIARVFLHVSDRLILARIDKLNNLSDLVKQINKPTSQNYVRRDDSRPLLENNFRKKIFKNHKFKFSSSSIVLFSILIVGVAAYIILAMVLYSSLQKLFERAFHYNYLGKSEKLILVDYVQTLLAYMPVSNIIPSKDLSAIIQNQNSTLVENVNRVYINYLIAVKDDGNKFRDIFNSIFLKNYCNLKALYIDEEQETACNDRQSQIGNQGLSSSIYKLQAEFVRIKGAAMKGNFTSANLGQLSFLCLIISLLDTEGHHSKLFLFE